MKEAKLVFVQAKAEDARELGKFLGGLEQKDYLFVIMPPETHVMTKKEALNFLSRLPV